MVSVLFPLALQSPGLFAAIVAMTQTYYTVLLRPETHASKEVLRHSGYALSEVRNRLMSASGGKEDDAVIVNISMLMGVDVSSLELFRSSTSLN